MPANPVETYLSLYAHVARLTIKGVARKVHYLLVAPIVAAGLDYLMEFITTFIRGRGEGFLVGLIYAFIQAAALSLVLFVGRAIIEQRQLDADSVSTGLGAFLSDLLSVFFPFALLSWIQPSLAGILFIAAVVLLPLLETVALSQASGYGIFEAAFNFFRRDAFPWLAGQVPMVALVLVWKLWTVFIRPFIPFIIASPASSVVFWALVLVAFLYRGVLFLTLDGTSPRRRAERFGGETGLS